MVYVDVLTIRIGRCGAKVSYLLIKTYIVDNLWKMRQLFYNYHQIFLKKSSVMFKFIWNHLIAISVFEAHKIYLNKQFLLSRAKRICTFGAGADNEG